MKRLSLLGLLAVSVGLLTGCPIFDDDPGGFNVGGGAGTTTPPAPGSCLMQSDCLGASETCGADGFCHIGDCTIWGCVGKDLCVVANQKASCQPGGVAPTGGAGGVPGSGGASMGGAGGAPASGGASMGGAGGAGPAPGGAGPAPGGAGPAPGGAGGAPGGGGASMGGAPGTGAGGQGGSP